MAHTHLMGPGTAQQKTMAPCHCHCVVCKCVQYIAQYSNPSFPFPCPVPGPLQCEQAICPEQCARKKIIY